MSLSISTNEYIPPNYWDSLIKEENISLSPNFYDLTTCSTTCILKPLTLSTGCVKRLLVLALVTQNNFISFIWKNEVTTFHCENVIIQYTLQ